MAHKISAIHFYSIQHLFSSLALHLFQLFDTLICIFGDSLALASSTPQNWHMKPYFRVSILILWTHMRLGGQLRTTDVGLQFVWCSEVYLIPSVATFETKRMKRSIICSLLVFLPAVVLVYFPRSFWPCCCVFIANRIDVFFTSFWTTLQIFTFIYMYTLISINIHHWKNNILNVCVNSRTWTQMDILFCNLLVMRSAYGAWPQSRAYS